MSKLTLRNVLWFATSVLLVALGASLIAGGYAADANNTGGGPVLRDFVLFGLLIAFGVAAVVVSVRGRTARSPGAEGGLSVGPREITLISAGLLGLVLGSALFLPAFALVVVAAVLLLRSPQRSRGLTAI